MTVVVRDRAALADVLVSMPRPLALVPTMGALHDGHVTLLRDARSVHASVIVSIFVNPLQFGPGEDFDRYPRSFERDLERCAAAGVDLVWAPSVEQMYRFGEPQVTVAAGPLGDILEGAARPGHFAGMLTVVTKLLTTVRPDGAYFGQKDYQQLTLIKRLVADLDLGVAIYGVPTVREADGLALSSRNIYLSTDEQHRAAALSQALTAGAAAAAGGADAVLAAARQVLDGAGIEPDYLVLRGADLGEPPPHGPARLLVAARVGSPRLIDNIAVTL